VAIFELPYDSVVRGKLPKGCEYCWRGSKLVLFVTGLCNMNCPYCPLSEKRRGRDVVYANENVVHSIEDALEEAHRMSAEGAGITGGEPTLVLDRTLEYIKLLKDAFGENFHIHMYTTTVNTHAIKELSDAGLDEIRFHPLPHTWKRIDKTPYYKALTVALDTGMDVGVEIPALPDKTEDMIILAEKLDEIGVQFLNMNELEIVESNYEALSKLGYEFRDDETVAALGSDLAALTVIYSADVDMTLHFCSSRYKDAGQLRQRFLRIARNIAKEYELVTEEGTIMRGIIIPPEGLSPEDVHRILVTELGIPKRFIKIHNNEVLVAPWVLEDIKEKIPGEKYIIEVHPTREEFEVERIPL